MIPLDSAPLNAPTKCWLWLTVLTLFATTVVQSQSLVEEEKPPSHIKLRAGVLHAPPFAIVGEYYDGEPRFDGFQIDLLQRLSQFALEDDNVVLEFDLQVSPPQYGSALDLIAKDCNSTVNPQPLEECQRFDMIVGDYYCNPARSLRIDFTPAWLRTTMSTVRHLEPTVHHYHPPDEDTGMAIVMNHEDRDHVEYTTLAQADQAGVAVCLLGGTYLMTVVKSKFPNAHYLECASFEECLTFLQEGRCALFADDELMLRYRASQDPTLAVTREQFNTQYMVWPLRRDLPEVISTYLKKWMYTAVANATLDELYFQYFQKELCPAGTAGDNCELPCNALHGIANTEGVCVCESTKWTGVDCATEVPEDTNLIPVTLKVLAFVMLGINLVAIVICGVWLFWQRNSQQVRVSQPFFLGLVLLGCGISSSTIIAMAQEDEGEGPVPACMAIPWLYSVGFCVTFGTLFAKIRRVHNIFKNSAYAESGMTLARRQQGGSSSNFGMSSLTRTRRQSATANFQETVGIILLVLLVDVLILVWWTIVSPLEWTRHVTATDQFGTALESCGFCTSDRWLVFFGIMASFHLCLLSAGCHLCYVARKIPTQFHEGRVLSIAMISNLQIFLVGVPILVVLGAAPGSSFFVRSVVIWMNDFVVVTLIFGNLMYSVHFQTESAEPAAVKAAIGQAMEQYANTTLRNSGDRHKGSSNNSGPKGSNNSGPKGSQNSGPGVTSHNSATLPAPIFESSSSSSDDSVDRETNGEKESSGVQSPKEIRLTRSELDQHNVPLRRGETYRRFQDSRPPSQSTPLPRSMLASSVSTHVCANLTPADHPTKRSAMSSVSVMSTASMDSVHEDDVGLEIKLDAMPGATSHRQSWVQRGMASMLDDSARRPITHRDEEQGCHTIVEGRTTDSRSVSNSRLPPVELPDHSPAHLSYAASRILHVRDSQEKAWKEREGRVETDSKSTLNTGCEDFNDETDNDASTINSEIDLAKESSSRRNGHDRSDKKSAASQRRQRRRSSAADSRMSSSSKRSSKLDKSDPGPRRLKRDSKMDIPDSVNC